MDFTTISQLIPHVFLPLELPGEIDLNSVASDENQLLSLLLHTIQQFKHISEVEETCVIFETWVKVQVKGHCGISNIRDGIRNLPPGRLFPLYVRAQNCGLLISIPKGNPENIVWSTFPASQKSSTVTGSSGDLEVTYPATSIKVKRSDLLRSDAFARQLSVLVTNEIAETMSITRKSGRNVVEVRDICDTRFISGWLPGVLVSRESTQSLGDIPQITKKIKDSVVFKNALVPFRRSGMWTTAKVILRISLVRDAGEISGGFLYKMIILQLMLKFLESPEFPAKESTGIEMLKKIGRRIRKLEDSLKQINIQPALLEVYHTILKDNTVVIHSARTKIDQNWNSIIERIKAESSVTIMGSKFKLTQSLSGNGLLNYLNSSNIVEAKNTGVGIPDVPPRHLISVRERYNHIIPRSAASIIERLQLSTMLFDFERNVSQNWSTIISVADTEYVWQKFDEYLNAAITHYNYDPVGMSRAIITALKMIQVWDKCVCSQYPTLSQHKIGIDSSFMKLLLAVTKEYIETVNDLEAYFQSRELAPYPSLLEKSPTSTSFSVRFAEQSNAMENLRIQILNEGRERAQAKVQEVQKARLYCDSLRARINNMNHTYYVNRFDDTMHSSSCEKCSLTEEEENYTVQVYEKPLPESLDNQRAVSFELLIPNAISCLRDILFTFSENLVRSIGNNGQMSIGDWHVDWQLQTHSKRSLQWKLSLGSSTKHFVKSHYSRRHPKYPDTDFVVNNGYNCYYVAAGTTIVLRGNYDECIKNWCTLKVESGSQYASMQWAINGTTRTPNEILASQSECHMNMSTSEFVEFGSLRCYNILQVRNLIQAVVQGTLSFKNESVFNLICQSLWQCSPRSNKLVRDAHQDFSDPIFLQECLSIMDNLRAKHRDNWQDHYVILTVIVFALNVAEKSSDQTILDKTGRVLLKCRNITETWSKDIQKMLSKITSEDTKQKDKLTLKLVEVNICRAFTFGAHKRLGSRIMSTSNHIQNWLEAIVAVYDQLAFIRNNSSNQLSLLLRRVLEIGVDIEEFFKNMSCLYQGLNMFLRSHYGGADELNFNNDTIWAFYTQAEQVCNLAVKRRNESDQDVIFQMDIVTGNFLVNGCTVSRLPLAMENHTDYQRAFPKMSFEVQPLSPNEVITKYAYDGSYYSFILDDGKLIVEETVSSTSTKRTLVPSTKMSGNFPHKFEHQYTHWWNRQNQTLEFFPRDPNTPLKIMGSKAEFLLEFSNHRKLKDLESERFLADICCPTFQRIAKIFNRLETTTFIHAWYESDGKYIIELPRLRLSFEVTEFEKNYGITIVSREYEGMKVANQQQLETLVGLKQGLLLTNDVDKILLVPHGTVTLNGKHNISILTCNLRYPPYFRYDVDERLSQLKTGETQTGWFYLAYLHAVTSSFIPDPFTGVTGTERAFQILNSGLCFPSQPFSPETILVIDCLRKLTPIRSYYPAHLQVMETVQWPSFISPLAAHDNFAHIVNNLVTKSNRLHFLFDGSEKIIVPNYDSTLTSKATWRRAVISNGIDGIAPSPHPLQKPPLSDFLYCTQGVENSIQVSHLCQLSMATLTNVQVFALLNNLLLNSHSLLGGIYVTDVRSETVDDWIMVDFPNSWLSIYKAARTVKQIGKNHDWIMFLSCLAFRQENSVSIDHLSILNAIAVHSNEFVSINPPPYPDYSDTSEYEYNDVKINLVLKQFVSTSLNDYLQSHLKRSSETHAEFSQRMSPSYDSECEQDLNAIERAVKNNWPCDTAPSYIAFRPKTQYYNWSEAQKIVSPLLKKWYRNRELQIFLKRVAETLQYIRPVQKVDVNTSELLSAINPIQRSPLGNEARCRISISGVPNEPLLVRLENFVTNNFDSTLLEDCKLVFRCKTNMASCVTTTPSTTCQTFPLKESNSSQIYNEFIKDLRISWNQWHSQKDSKDTATVQPSNSSSSSIEIWKYICDYFELHSRIYFLSDWCPRITPTSMLPLICKKFQAGELMSNLREIVGAYGVLITKEQQRCRVQRYERQGNELNLLEKEKELCNVGHINWSPESRPEWLLLEIENDFLIRQLQVIVAQQMQSPDGGKNSLMQMNMGEGKTAVIIPLLALSLADGLSLCRITVLRSLYQINMKALALKIGGLLLNRRVYTMPCRRDYPIESGNVQLIMNAYQECFDTRGVLLTLSEHRLSFELKMQEKALADSKCESKAINDILNWLKIHARDVLDESDEILHVKYQLLYTLGEPLTISGGALRWNIVEKILRLVPNQIKILLKDEKLRNQIEFKVASSDQEFPQCRIFTANAFDQLCAGLSQDVIEGKAKIIPEPPPAVKDIVLKFMTQEIINEDEMQQLYSSSCFSLQSHKESLLILRGLMACGVLRSCLNKRWRVNYGVNPTGHRRMAVPFRAKDVAAERAEFGHPDMAIVLTLLSYYYSGLNDAQLEDTFTRLLKLNFAEEEYQSWISLLPPTTPELTSIKKLSGINLRDYRQKYKILFPALKRNMATINFWLGQAVFPVESKQFGAKIGCSAWDLCRDNTTYPTTGFSGTNDTKLLLPRTIIQKDLPALLGTNGKVLDNLLRPENDHYEGLEAHISANNIIKKLVIGNIKVLLDVGAIMLEMNNEQVADEWLTQCQEIDAVVFFDDKDYLVVKAKGASQPVQFETSSFRSRLDRCGIYLDEVHTRGTDLKIPLGTIAVVTLGKGVRKDTLAQGCMRMRKLGQGHSVHFWGSSEVHTQILKFTAGKAPGSEEVLKWAIQNSVQFMEEGFIHWAASASYELQKRTAKMICEDDQLKLLAQLCSQNEVLELISMYGLERSFQTYPAIAQNMIDKAAEHLRKILESSSHTHKMNLADSQFVLEHLKKYVDQLRRTTNILDEEQERELEPELEEETEVERPRKATAQAHILNERLRTFIRTGDNSAFGRSDLLALNKVFVNSGLWNFCETASNWGERPDFKVLATDDFERTVVQTHQLKSNDFLRPVLWIYNTIVANINLAIIMSPFEVNSFWNEFKSGKGILHMYGPRLFRDQETLHESGPLMVPSRSGTHCIFPNLMTAALDIFSGSLYFRNEADERFYSCVAGISPKPRPPDEDTVFQLGGIVNGFINPIYRNCLPMFKGVSSFEEHPERLIRGITEARRGVFSDMTHVGNVIVHGRKNFADFSDD